MTIDKRLLRERNKMRSSRPKFRRQESWRFKRLKTSWRRPMGIDNKMRHHKRGWPKIVRIGYRGPKAVRGLTSNGMEEVLVHNLPELEQIDKNLQVARIASAVGVKKKINITNRADELEIKIINRPEEALTFATISEISEELLLEDEDLAKGDKKAAPPRKKKPSTSALSDKELEELAEIEKQLSGKTTPKKTTTKSTETKTPSKPKSPTATTKKTTTATKGTTTTPKKSTPTKSAKTTSTKTATTATKKTTSSPSKNTSTKSSTSKTTAKTSSSKEAAGKTEKKKAASTKKD